MEITVQDRTVEAFSVFNDIEVVVEPSSKKYDWNSDKTLRPDIVIEYGQVPFAVIELSTENEACEQHICNQFKRYQQNTSILCYIAKIGDVFYYYSDIERQLFELSFEDVLKKLMRALKDGERNADNLKQALEDKICSINPQKYNNYYKMFLEHLKKGSLMRHGNMLFLSRETEIDFMISILENEARNSTKETSGLCRYTSAKGFFLSLKSNSFRLNSIETMNDAFETKVIDDFEKLKNTKHSINEALYNGYVMCFSDISREDKLFNWYMYGSQGEGVCFSISRRNIAPKEYYYVFAPVVYVHKRGNKIECGLLEFLNEMMDMKIDKKTFKLRLWHYWKYFFKLDFYDEEIETRLVCITDEIAKSDWNSFYNVPYKFIERKIVDLPFEIVRLTLGPKFCNSEMIKEYVTQQLKNINVRSSYISGFRG